MIKKKTTVEDNNESRNDDLELQRIIVIGASAGGFEALKKLVSGLPPEFVPPVFLLRHNLSLRF